MVFRITGGSAGDEAEHDDGQRAAPEDHHEQRIGQHHGRGGQRRHPGLAGLLQQLVALHQHAAGDADQRDQDAGRQAFAGGDEEAADDVLLG